MIKGGRFTLGRVVRCGMQALRYVIDKLSAKVS